MKCASGVVAKYRKEHDVRPLTAPHVLGKKRAEEFGLAHLIFGLEPLVLHRRLGDGVAGEAQVVARHQSHRLGLNDDLQGWNHR